MKVRQSIGKLVNHGLRTIGLEVRSVPRRDDRYYPQVRTCQIPHLAILYSIFLGDREYGTFVEVGAYDGISFSNTWGLAERGWDGLMIEPDPATARECAANHRDHPNVRTRQTAIGDSEDTELTLHVAGALTTASAPLRAEYETTAWASSSLTERRIVVPCTTLDAVLHSEGVAPDFDVLVVDVEGFEREVFAGFSIERWRPRMMIVELADTHPDLHATRTVDHQLGRALVGAGYDVAAKDSINTVLVRSDVFVAAYAAGPAGCASI